MNKMATHTGRSFLNSCLKVPLDPCNNCPAPIYNRPKMYLGRSSVTSATSNTTKQTTRNTESPRDLNSILNSRYSIQSLAKFYDSIPDYCDINHLAEEEFYSTLDTLKITCREFRTKSEQKNLLDVCSSSSISSYYPGTSKNNSKRSNKKKSKSGTKKKPTQDKKLQPCFNADYQKDIIERMRLNSFKDDSDEDRENTRRTIKMFNDKIKKVEKSLSCNNKKTELPQKMQSNKNINKSEKIQRPTSKTTNIRAHIRRSFSVNDINATPILSSNEKIEQLEQLFNIESLGSNVSKTNKTTTKESNVKIKNSKPKGPPRENILGIPFTIFDLSPMKTINKCSPSPVHPVARPNLAATLRVEVSKKKVKELQNTCTYLDTTPQMDWEVRKTPAWKSLALNESHKEILSLRLATRKAEQALQQRSYEQHMKRMHQRVKSAPLLLEGTTYWGPHVGKVTHICQQESFKHTCQRKQHKQRRKSFSDRRSEIVVSVLSSSTPDKKIQADSDGDDLSSLDRAFL